jgi:hypothetical protein
MRVSSRFCLASFLALLAPLAVLAQQPERYKIETAHVGYQLNPAAPGEFKAGAWTPVYINLKAGKAGAGRGQVIVETADSDDVRNRYSVPLPAGLTPGEVVPIVGYTKPGHADSDVVISVQVDGQEVARHEESYQAMGLDQYLYVTLGSHLPSMRQALVAAANANQPEPDKDPMSNTGACRLAHIDDIQQMPTRWYAYEAVDLVFLSTGGTDRESGFLKQMVDRGEKRRWEALAEWVRRGGRLIISLGSNQDLVMKADALEAIRELLPVTSTGTVELPHAREINKWTSFFGKGGEKDAAFPKVEIAKLELKPGRESDPQMEVKQDGHFLVVRGAYGLGRVTVAAFDLDQEPFTSWDPKGQIKFWDALRVERKPVPGQGQEGNQPMQAFGPRNRGFGVPDESENDLASQLEMNLEQFDDVPVISFGWVALFILLYILVVGPLDYFFLKKVVKRLELTWITFPAVVITISVIAYFTAYWLKGNDQKINKVDLVDIDLETQQVYGSTWFTIFSPRIQNYTIGLEPAPTDWAPAGAPGQQDNSVVLSWLGRPETGWGGYGRQRSQGLFHRAYDYAEDAHGLTGVPIPVWSTKSFTATWEAPLDRARPLVEIDAHVIKEGKVLKPSGTITSHLPVALEDVVVFPGFGLGREDTCYLLGRLGRDTPQRLENIFNLPSQRVEAWLSTIPLDPPRKWQRQPQGNIAVPSTPTEATAQVVKRLLFYQAGRDNRRNNALRHLDQQWRRSSQKYEIILFGRIPRQEGAAEDLTRSSESPTRLWLGALPGPENPRRPALSGSLSQETYVRMIIPVTQEK